MRGSSGFSTLVAMLAGLWMAQATLAQDVAHGLLPVRVGRVLGDQHEVGARGEATHQRQVAAPAPHHLDHERALVTRRRAVDGVDRLDDAVQSGVGTDRHVGP